MHRYGCGYTNVYCFIGSFESIDGKGDIKGRRETGMPRQEPGADPGFLEIGVVPSSPCKPPWHLGPKFKVL